MAAKTVSLPTGERVAALGQGTWRMGEERSRAAEEAAALRLGLDLGLTLIDTAEMYGEGGAETIVAEAIAGRRDDVFLVSKVYPHNATRAGVRAACERSLQRLKTDRIDLYLLHWPGAVPLEETVAGFADLQEAGKIRHFGVSNFDTRLMEQLWGVQGGAACAANQVLYSLVRREVEWSLLPWSRGRSVPLMAYSPVGQGRLTAHAALRAVAARHSATAMQVALAWLLRHDHVIVIPKATRPAHVRENAAAPALHLTPEDLATLDAGYPPPTRPVSLPMG